MLLTHPIMFPQHLCLFVLLVSRVIILSAWDITELAHKGMNAGIVIVVSLLRPKPVRRGRRITYVRSEKQKKHIHRSDLEEIM